MNTHTYSTHAPIHNAAVSMIKRKRERIGFVFAIRNKLRSGASLNVNQDEMDGIRQMYLPGNGDGRQYTHMNRPANRLMERSAHYSPMKTLRMKVVQIKWMTRNGLWLTFSVFK